MSPRPRKEWWPTCKQHPRYRAVRRPSGTCEVCWAVWFWEMDGRVVPERLDYAIGGRVV